MNKQKGQISIVIIISILVIGVYFLQQGINNAKSSQIVASNTKTISCRPEENSNPVLLAIEGKQSLYRQIKSHILIQRQFVDTAPGGDLKEDHMDDFGVQSINGENYYVYSPSEDTTSEGFPYKPGDPYTFTHVDFESKGFVFVTKKESIMLGDPPVHEYWFFDVYLEVSEPIPDEIKNCENMPSEQLHITIAPTPITDPLSKNDNKQLQLGDFKFTTSILQINNWWTPACKPIVYLYPEKKQNVLVKLDPKGFLLETIPKYPKEGWFVESYPDGKIVYKGKTYNYLYYESKIKDEEITIPEEGFLVAYEELEIFFQKILPKTGLNVKESIEFIDYWKKALPKVPYYFIGLMDRESIDKIEPLTIIPTPESVIRVRFYFRPLEDKNIQVKEPVIIAGKRDGFSVVEWGGMVKTDKDHPFTCSQ